MLPARPTAFVLEHVSAAEETILDALRPNRFGAYRNQRAQRGLLSALFGQTDHGGLMLLGQSAQAREHVWRRTCSGAEIQNDQAEASRADQQIGGSRGQAGRGNSYDDQRFEIDVLYFLDCRW